MTFLPLIPINLLRHRVRSLIGMAGIAFGVAAMLSVVTILQGAIHMFERILQTDSDWVVFERNVSDLFFSSVPLTAVDQMAAWPEVAAAHPVLFGIVSSEDRPVITCFGIRHDDPRVRADRWTAGDPSAFLDDARGVVVGERAAAFLGVTSGEDLAVGRETFPVLGVIRTENGFEDGGVFMPLTTAAAFFRKEGFASVASVRLSDEDRREAFRDRVAAEFPELTALENEEFSRTYSQFRILKTTSWAVGGCAFLLGGLSVANTMIMSVFTRIREIAILRVCGFSDLQVAGLVFGESVAIAAAGIAAGIGLSLSALTLLSRLPVMQGYIETRPSTASLATVALLALATGLAGALYPAIFALRIQAAEALRFE